MAEDEGGGCIIKSFFTSMRPGDMVLRCDLNTDYRDSGMLIYMLARRVDVAWGGGSSTEAGA